MMPKAVKVAKTKVYPFDLCTEYDDLTRKLEQRELQLNPLKPEELFMNSL